MRTLAIRLALWLSSLAGAAAAHTTFLVTNSDDGGPGSLRQALADANANPGLDLVHFAIPGTGPHAIRPTSQLPSITDPVVIDGYTQAGAVPNTNAADSGLGSNAVLAIDIDGTDMVHSGGQLGLNILSSGVTVRGLAVHSFFASAVNVAGSDVRVEGCFLGTDVTGTLARPNTGSGVFVDAPDCTIGGTTPAARNVISANVGSGVLVDGHRTHVYGNLIGTDASGTFALGNKAWGVSIGFLASPQDVLVGGSEPSMRNVLSGQVLWGVSVGPSGFARVQGNLVGTDVSGTAAIPNGAGGIDVGFGRDVLVGGPEPGAGNVVSGNAGAGIQVTSDSARAVVQGNRVGVDASGSVALGNPVGIQVWKAAKVGGQLPGRGNLVSGNGFGIRIRGDGADVRGNLVGTDASGASPLGNDVGIELRLADRNVVQGNRILFSTSDGVRLVASQQNRLTRNSIAGSGRIGIDLVSEADGPSGVTPNDPGDLDTGPNGLQNFPVLDYAFEIGTGVVVVGRLASRPEGVYVIELFGSPSCGVSEHGEGETFLASRAVTTDGRGLAFFTFVVPGPAGRVVTATATDASGNTSELSLCRPVLPLRMR